MKLTINVDKKSGVQINKYTQLTVTNTESRTHDPGSHIEIEVNQYTLCTVINNLERAIWACKEMDNETNTETLNTLRYYLNEMYNINNQLKNLFK